jgi:hypothetical protein
MRPDIGQRMAAAVRRALAPVLQDKDVVFGAHQQHATTTTTTSGSSSSSSPGVTFDLQVVHEPPERAVAEGGSVVLVAETSTGCLLGASALAQRGVSAEAVGAMAARDLLEELRSGAAADQWCVRAPGARGLLQWPAPASVAPSCMHEHAPTLCG